MKCCCPLIKSVKCTLDNSKYTGYNIWHSKDWSALLYQKTETETNQMTLPLNYLPYFRQQRVSNNIQDIQGMFLAFHRSSRDVSKQTWPTCAPAQKRLWNFYGRPETLPECPVCYLTSDQMTLPLNYLPYFRQQRVSNNIRDIQGMFLAFHRSSRDVSKQGHRSTKFASHRRGSIATGTRYALLHLPTFYVHI